LVLNELQQQVSRPVVSLGKILGKIQGGQDPETPKNGTVRACCQKYAYCSTTPRGQSCAVLGQVQYLPDILGKSFA